MTYTDEAHRHAVTLLEGAQLDRLDAGLEPLDDDRAVESMAPENTGTRRERFGTIVTRVRLAAVADRSDRRRAAIASGEPLSPIELEAAATGRARPSRAARQAAARQARATRNRGDHR